jgi:kinesin family protein C2/C3
LQHEQNKFEEMKKLEEQDFSRLKKDKVRSEIEISQMKQDLEMMKRSHEDHVLQLELQASESKAEYEKRIRELKCQLADARKQVMKGPEAFLESRYLNWKNKEHTYQSFLNQQVGVSRCFFVLLFALWLLIFMLFYLPCSLIIDDHEICQR